MRLILQIAAGVVLGGTVLGLLGYIAWEFGQWQAAEERGLPTMAAG